MARPGEDLQRLVQVIERATHDDGNVRVDSPKRLPDKDTGRPREHDLVLTFTQRHHTFVMALECRDWSRKVGVPHVEAFYAKCQRTGIDRDIMVSSTGFAQTALEKAASYNIGCLSLDQAARLNWCLASGVAMSHRHIIHVHLHVVPERQIAADAKLYTDNGTLIGENEMMQIGRQCLEDAFSPTDGPVTKRFVDRAPAFHLVDENGHCIGLRRLDVDVTYEITTTVVPLEFREYVDAAKAKQICTVAVANVNCARVQGDIVILREEDGETKVMFVPASLPAPSNTGPSLGPEQQVDRSSPDPEPGRVLG
jgi:Restriction endonuclease